MLPIHLEQVRAKVVDELVAYLQSSLVSRKKDRNQPSSQTLHTYVKVLLAFFHWCLADEEYAEFVKLATVKRIRKPKLEQPIIEVFSKEQLEYLLSACANEYNRPRSRQMCISPWFKAGKPARSVILS